MCIAVTIFTYYKFRFDQLNDQIKSIQNLQFLNGRKINKRREKQLMKLIHKHNLTSIEVYPINLLTRRTAAATFIIFSITKDIVCTI